MSASSVTWAMILVPVSMLVPTALARASQRSASVP